MGKPKNNKKTSKVEEASDEEIADIKPKKTTTKQPAKAASSAKASFSALAALEDDDNKLPSDNEDNEESNNVEPEEPEPVADVKPKKGAKNNKKQKASKAAESDDEGQEPAADIKPKKNNNKKSKAAENDDEEPAAEPAKPEPAKAAKGKKGKKNATDYLASLSLEEEEPAEVKEEKKPEPKPAEKGKKGKKGKSQEDYLATLDEPTEEQEEKKPEPPKPAPAAKGGKKGKKGQSQDDYLSSLAEEPAEEAEAKPEPPKPAPAAKGKKGKKGGSQEDYLASLEEEPSEAPKQEEPKKPEAKKAEPKKKPEAKKKEEPKKQDKKAPAKAPAKPLNPKLAALKALQEQKKKEEEELQRIEEEKRRQEEELIKKMQEEAEKEKQRQIQLKIEEKRKIKELKKKGIFKTKKQIEAEERAKRMVELMIQQGGVAALDKQKAQAEAEAEEEEEEEVEEQPKPQKQEKPKAAPVAEQPKQEEKKEKSWEEMLSDDEEEAPKEKSWEEMLSDDEEKPAQKAPATKSATAEKPAKQPAEKPAEKAETKEEGDTENSGNQKKDLRSPICCVLGHVDTGKTKLLDKIRNTNVQLGEAGGITQQIGATWVPMEAVKTQTQKLGEKIKLDFQVPGLLIIDTPGHESFTNLRSRGANLCDIAILVVDIMHGLERQTIESINLLKQKKVPFVVALNKVDQIYDWQNHANTPIRDSLKKQPKHTIVQFEDLVRRTQGYFQEQGLNAELYYKNKEVKKVVSLVPTSAITGEGMADLLAVVTQLTQMFMAEKIAYKDEFQCTILEVKVVEGHGTTIDVILVNGVIHESDRIVVCTLNGPVVTTIRALLTPKPLREIRVKGEYVQHKQIKAAMGIKIAAQDLDGAVPGSSLLILKEGDDVEEMKEEVMKDLNQLLRKVSKSDKGVYVQSSTLGSLEALLEFLHTSKIPVCGINIGPVHKADVVRASTMLEHAPEFAVILAFDVVVTKDAQEYAEKTGIIIFTANIIYHLFDKFTAHMKKIQDEKKQAALAEAVWPCIVRVIPGNVFHNKDPITIGVDIVEGKLKLQTPLIVPTKQGLELGRVVGIQHNKQPVNEAEKGKAVAIQIDSGKTTTFGRHFDHTDLLYSKLTRASLDKLKEVYRDELKTDDLKLIVKIKKVLGVQ